MTIKYIFHNFTDKPFTGYWNGKPYTFKPGIKKYYPKGIAEHFAKHLTNEILTAKGLEVYTSPKKPLEVPQFMEVFNKARLYEETPDEDNLDILGEDVVNGPSMNVKVEPAPVIDPYDASSQPAVGPGATAQIVGDDVGDDKSDGDTPAESEASSDEATFEGA